MIVFLVIAMMLTAIMYGYVAWRLHIVSPSLRFWVRFYLFVVWLTSLAPLIFHYQHVAGDWVDIFIWFVYLNMGFFSLLMVVYLVMDVLHLCMRPFKRNPERRAFFKSSAAHISMLGAAGMTTGFGLEQAVGGAVIKEVHIPLGAPKALHDLKIVQFTDLHIGPMIKRDDVESLVSQMNALNADMIVMTGDLVDGSVARLKQDVAPLANLKAKVGKYFITGNHEYYSGAEDWIAEMKRLGFTVLLNEHELIEYEGAKLLLAGVTDYRAHQYISAHQSSPKQAMQGAPDADVKILLAHQPKSIFEATEAGFDLQISGHTHGGQYYPWNFIAKMANPYIKGLHLHDNKTWIYVSPGTGYWGPPIRLGNEPEITVFKLV
ncbi:metallophosphoesterase [Ghiorsea bivora]|uniref:metallophosphoesterase n=1 Tax=Ghiorsea bivora TaxID=1485545 RepID=UPI0005705177|nr:metallophosphoesterase [Ghiorsea bivora]